MMEKLFVLCMAQNLWMQISIGLLLLVVVIFILFLYCSSVIREKNKIIVQLMGELSSYRQIAYTESDCCPPPITDDSPDYQLFLQMDKEVTERRLYLEATSDRQLLMRLSGVGKNKIAPLVRMFTGTNITGYLNAKRMEHAVQLMADHPEYTIKAIAEDCGIGSQTTFIRVFKSVYGMTPSEYQKTNSTPPASNSEL